MARTKPIKQLDTATEDGQPAGASLLRRIMSPRILIVGSIIVLVLVTGVVAWVFFLTGPDEAALNTDQAATSGVAPQGLPGQAEPVFDDIIVLEPFDKIRLKPSRDLGYVSLTLALELVRPDMKPQVLAQVERIRQVVTDEVNTMTWMVLRNPDGKLKLKFRLIKNINALMQETTVRDVYFTLFLMQ